MKSLFALKKYFVNHKLHTFGGLVFVLLANLFKTYNPQVVRHAVDAVTEKLKNTAPNETLTSEFSIVLLLFLATYIGVALMEGVFTFLMRQTIIVVSRIIEFDMKNELYEHYQKLDLAFYRKNNTGDLMNRITEDVARVRMFIGPSIMYMVNLVCMFIFCTVAMFHVNKTLAAYVLIPLPFLSLAVYLLNTRINKVSEELQSRLSDITTNAQESYSGIRVIQAYAQENSMLGFFKKESEDYKNKSLKLAKVEAFYFPLIMFLIGLSMVIIIYEGGILKSRNEISYGNIAEFMMYLNMLTFPVSALGWAVSLTQRAAVSMRRINEFLNIQSTVINTKGTKKKMEGEIEFRNVDFVYPDTGIYAIKNLSFKIISGERWAVVGKTGSGKSTLADLMMRMFDITSGEILIDGTPIKDWNTGELRRQIGFVPQDMFLFSESLKDNIGFGIENINLETATYFAESASIAEEIKSFPESFETIVGERGVTLSGGQKQRISIARALAKNPEVLILDDCLSAVDASTEKKIERNLDNNINDKTCVIITHRIFSLMKFDNILVLDNGQLVELGTHEQLLSKKGLYAEMYANQMKDLNEKES